MSHMSLVGCQQPIVPEHFVAVINIVSTNPSLELKGSQVHFWGRLVAQVVPAGTQDLEAADGDAGMPDFVLVPVRGACWP